MLQAAATLSAASRKRTRPARIAARRLLQTTNLPALHFWEMEDDGAFIDRFAEVFEIGGE